MFIGINWRDEGSEIDADDSEGLDGLEFESREGETWKKGCAIWHKHKSVLRCTRPRIHTYQCFCYL